MQEPENSIFTTRYARHLFLGKLVALGYRPHDMAKRMLGEIGINDVKLFDYHTHLHDTQAMAIGVEDTIVVTFRGTESPTDVKTNLRFAFVPSPLGGRMHDGFSDALEDIIPGNKLTTWQKIMSEVNEMALTGKYKSIQFAGHSLGGALAIMATTKFIGTDINFFTEAAKLECKGVVTFGAPKTFDKDGEDNFFTAVNKQATHYIHRSDLVPFVPLIGAQKTRIGPFNRPSCIGKYCSHKGIVYLASETDMIEVGENSALWKRVSDERMAAPAREKQWNEYLNHHNLTHYYFPPIKAAAVNETNEQGGYSNCLLAELEKKVSSLIGLVPSKGLEHYPAILLRTLWQELVPSARPPKWSELLEQTDKSYSSIPPR